MAVAPLVGTVKPLGKIGDIVRSAQARHRHRHLVGLAAIAHPGVPARLQPFARKLLAHQGVQRVLFHLGEDRVESPAVVPSTGVIRVRLRS